MLRIAAIIFILSSSLSAIAQDRPPQLPENTIDCAQFRKTGSKEWTEVDTAIFNLGGVRDIHLTNQPVTPGFFRFGGIDVYPVLEQKCGALAIGTPSESTVLATVTSSGERAPPAKTELQQDAPPASTQAPAQTLKIATQAEDKSPKSKPVTAQCGDGKAVYAADSLTDGAGEKPVIEIAFQNKIGEGNSDFELKNQRGSEVLWAYKGKIRRGRFTFNTVPAERRADDRLFMSTSMSLNRQETTALTPIFIKPSRSGAGEPILYLNGLRTIFASKESVRRFKFEGKPASEPLPEVYYLDRCE
jgi:hypothetical protein